MTEQGTPPRLRRDGQQWIFDYVVKETGAVYHWSSDAGTLPKSVKSHAQISKHLGKQAQQIEELAGVERAAGHERTALQLYVAAAESYLRAQHPVFALNDEKRFLYAGVRRCYDEVIRLAPYKIERIDVPWNGSVVSGYLHLLPGAGVKAPLLFHVPGCDTAAEASPDPLDNAPHHRGMHVFSFDGPGLAQSNLRGIKLTADNFEHAAKAALDVLVKRPEIDAKKVVAFGTGMGSFWAMRFAALDHRVAALATKSSYGSKTKLMEDDSPRYKQLFAFLTQARSEAELDAVMAEMTMDGHMQDLSCPTLMVVGEYDLRDPIDEVYRLFDQLKVPAELWVFADQFHKVKLPGGGETVSSLMYDWLADRLAGKAVAHPGEVLYIEPSSTGPNSPDVTRKRRWFDDGAKPKG